MPVGNKKNLYLDRPSKSRGHMSGEDVTWTGQPTSEHIYKYLKDMGLVEEPSENLIREMVRKTLRELPGQQRIDECIVVGGQASGENVLVKSRDRNYDANVKIVRDLTDDGVEIVYMIDLDSGYIEGMNSEGIGIINATLDVQDGKEAEVAQPSKSGPRIRQCLSNKNLASTIDDILNYEGGVEGHTIVSSPKSMYAIEHPGGGSVDTMEKNTVTELPMDGTFDVFTNHGENIPAAGYDLEGHPKGYHSSLARQKQAQQALVDEENFERIPVLMTRQNFEPASRFNMRRDIPKGMRTVSQVAMHLPDLEFVFYYFPHVCTLKTIEDRTPEGYEPRIGIRIVRYKNYKKSGKSVKK